MGKKKANNGIIEVLRASMQVTSAYFMSDEERKNLSELKARFIREANEIYPTYKRSKLFETVETLSVTKEQWLVYHRSKNPKSKPNKHKINLKMNIYEEEL